MSIFIRRKGQGKDEASEREGQEEMMKTEIIMEGKDFIKS